MHLDELMKCRTAGAKSFIDYSGEKLYRANVYVERRIPIGITMDAKSGQSGIHSSLESRHLFVRNRIVGMDPYILLVYSLAGSDATIPHSLW